MKKFKTFKIKDLDLFDKYLDNGCFENNILRKQLGETLPFYYIKLLDEKSRIGAAFPIFEKGGKIYLSIYDMNDGLKGVRKERKDNGN